MFPLLNDGRTQMYTREGKENYLVMSLPLAALRRAYHIEIKYKVSFSGLIIFIFFSFVF